MKIKAYQRKKKKKKNQKIFRPSKNPKPSTMVATCYWYQPGALITLEQLSF